MKALVDMNHKHNYNLETMLCSKCAKKIDASGYAKARGLVNLNQLIEISGRDRSTLNRWFNDDFDWFKLVVDGAANQITKGEE